MSTTEDTATSHTDADTIDVLVRMADAHHTYISWIWMREPFTQQAGRIDAERITPLIEELDASLIKTGDPDGGTPGAGASGSAHHALTAGALAAVHTERDLSWRLSQIAFPPRLRDQLREHLDAGTTVRIRITPSPRMSRIPWVLLMVDQDGPRLLELFDIVIDPPVTAHADRSRQPVPWNQVQDCPAVHVIDPRVPRDAGLPPGLGKRGPLAAMVTKAAASGTTVADPDLCLPTYQRTFSRRDLSRALRTHEGTLSRLFYFGHISSATDEPGSASLHLSDEYWNGTDDSEVSVWGMSEPVRATGRDGYRQPAQPGNHMPLSALDLMLGTTDIDLDDPDAAARVWALYGTDTATRGHQLWPMPPRVALIACEGGVDFRSSETFGLVMALIDAGADIVTTTCWPLPTDYAVQQASGHGDLLPTTDLALAVDHAHTLDEPLAEIRSWQREQLDLWQRGGAIEHTPLVWAAVTTTLAPARSDTGTAAHGG